MLPCDCGSEYGGPSGRWTGSYATFLSNLQNYTGSGGRMFASHWARQWIEGGGYTNPFPGVANCRIPSRVGRVRLRPARPQLRRPDQHPGFPKGFTAFSTWMGIVGAQTAPGLFLVNASRYDTTSVAGASQPCGSRTPAATRTTASPTTTRARAACPCRADTRRTSRSTPHWAGPTKYGRVMYTDMHLASGFNSEVVPVGACPSGRAHGARRRPRSSCSSTSAPVRRPFRLRPCAYYPATFTVDYQGMCPTGQVVHWRFFDWETVTPADSNIVFKAQEATSQASLTGATTRRHARDSVGRAHHRVERAPTSAHLIGPSAPVAARDPSRSTRRSGRHADPHPHPVAPAVRLRRRDMRLREARRPVRAGGGVRWPAAADLAPTQRTTRAIRPMRETAATWR